jgi:multidrug efflux pump
MVSQALTLFTTPVVYLYLDRLRLRFAGRKQELRLTCEVPAQIPPV